MIYQLPAYQPVIPFDDSQIGRGWRRVSVGEVIKPSFQAYVLMPPNPGWRISSCDGMKVTGMTHYRAPASLRAWLTVAPQIARKWYSRLTQKTPSS